LESNGSPDTIQREVLVFKGDVIATVLDPDLGIAGGGGCGLPKNFFRPFGPQSGLKMREGATPRASRASRAPPRDPPLC